MDTSRRDAVLWDRFISGIEPGSPQDKIVGMIYGHALGDAVGLQTEFKFCGDIDEIHFPYDQPIRDFPKCDWTDDTDHLILVMQSLTDHKMQLDECDIAARLKNWVTSGFSELGDTMGMGLGGTTAMTIRHDKFLTEPKVAAGEIWHNSGKRLAPNGSLMRTSIIGALPDQDRVARMAADLSMITHYDPRCVAACVFQSTLLHLLTYGQPLMRSEDVDDLMNAAWVAARPFIIDEPDPVEFANRRHQPTPKSYSDQRFKTREDEFLHWISLGYNENLKKLDLDEQVKRGFVLKCLACSVYVMQMIYISLPMGETIGFKKFISTLALEAGDADTNCAVAGATLGAHLGYSKLPADWIAALPNRAWLNSKVLKFLDILWSEDNE